MKTATVWGNHGRLTIDETGKILSRTGYKNINRFNVHEFVQYYGGFYDSIDILSIGYWTNSGQYEPPEAIFRQLAA